MDVVLREPGVYRFGAFRLDATRRSLFRDGERVKLPERLFDVLLHLVSNHGRLVEREELLQSVWAGRTVEDSNVSQAIFALRRVLKQGGGSDSAIVTVSGRGFRFTEPVVFEADSQQANDAPPAEAPVTRWRGRTPLAMAALALVVASVSLLGWRSGAPPARAPAAADAAFAPPAHSVAVLAFDNLSGDPGQAYFSDGLSEQLIDSLTQITAMQVAGRTSSFSFRGSTATVGQIARALNVGAVLAGSVRRAGNRVVVTAQLTNGLTGFNIWSRVFERDQGDVVRLQTDIAQTVAQSLQVKLLGTEADKLTLGGTTNAAAYDAFLRGTRTQRDGDDATAYRAALADFDRAIALDPDFAKAQSGRATVLVNIALTGAGGSAAAQRLLYQQALDAADRAIALAPGLSGAHSARGAVLNFGFLDHAGALREAVQAQMLSPGSSAIEINYAAVELSLGHADLAVAAAYRSTQIDPLSTRSWGQTGRILFMARRYEEALAALARVASLNGKLTAGYTALKGGVLIAQGHPAEARALCAAGADPDQIEVLAIADHQLGHPAESAADLARLQAAQGDAGAFSYAEIYAQWGQPADALRWLETAVRLRDSGLAEVGIDPMLDPIRSEPRFKEIVARLRATPL